MADRLWQDLGYALRQVRRAPGFAIAVIVTLTLSIGANTALFTLLNAIVLRTLPVRNPERLVLLQATSENGQQNKPIYYRTFEELAKLPVFDTLTLYSSGGLLQTQVRGVLSEGLIEAVTPGFHESLGLQPFLGRYFTSNESPVEGPAAAVAVISHRFWQQHFKSDPNAIGEQMLVSGEPMTVIGVTPPEYKGFYVDGGYGFSVPISTLNRQLGTDAKRPVRGLNGVGGLKDGVTIEQARAAVEAAWLTVRVEALPGGLSAVEQKEIPTERIRVESLSRGFSGLRTRYGKPLTVLVGITALLLAIGCVNLSGLLLARTAAREHQFALRLSLGATRARLIQQLLVESFLLTALGTAAAIALAWWASQALSALLWENAAPLSLQVTPDARVLASTALVALLTGLVVAALPALTAGRMIELGLRSAQPRGSSSNRAGKMLLVAQVAMSLVLLVGAGLFASSLANLKNIDGGFRTDGVRWSRLFAVPGGYQNQVDREYYPRLVQQLSELPGMRSVALSSMFPTFFNFGNFVTTQSIGRSHLMRSTDDAQGVVENISPRFFETAGIPFVRGRDFTWDDSDTRPGVVIVNETLRRELFGNGDAIGETIRIGLDPKRAALEIVGVVNDSTVGDLRAPHQPVAFRPRMQELPARSPVLTFRTAGDAATADDAVAGVIKSLGHEYPRGFHSLTEQIDLALIQERLLAGLSSFFAGLAVLLAVVGLYGLLAYNVARRTREIGIRMALGASRRGVLRMIIMEGLLLTVIGVAFGLAGAVAAGRLVRSLLFGLAPLDVTTFAVAAALFLVIGAIAGLWPAVRASRVDPMSALRAE